MSNITSTLEATQSKTKAAGAPSGKAAPKVVQELTGSAAVLAPGDPGGTRLAFPLDRAATLVERMVQRAPATAAAGPDRLGRGRLRPAPLHP